MKAKKSVKAKKAQNKKDAKGSNVATNATSSDIASHCIECAEQITNAIPRHYSVSCAMWSGSVQIAWALRMSSMNLYQVVLAYIGSAISVRKKYSVNPPRGLARLMPR